MSLPFLFVMSCISSISSHLRVLLSKNQGSIKGMRQGRCWWDRTSAFPSQNAQRCISTQNAKLRGAAAPAPAQLCAAVPGCAISKAGLCQARQPGVSCRSSVKFRLCQLLLTCSMLPSGLLTEHLTKNQPDLFYLFISPECQGWEAGARQTRRALSSGCELSLVQTVQARSWQDIGADSRGFGISVFVQWDLSW